MSQESLKDMYKSYLSGDVVVGYNGIADSVVQAVGADAKKFNLSQNAYISDFLLPNMFKIIELQQMGWEVITQSKPTAIEKNVDAPRKTTVQLDMQISKNDYLRMLKLAGIAEKEKKPIRSAKLKKFIDNLFIDWFTYRAVILNGGNVTIRKSGENDQNFPLIPPPSKRNIYR